MKDPIGFIGLGNMGLGMARNILKAGFPLIGHDSREEPLRVIEGMGGEIARRPREVSEKARVTFIAVLNYPQIEQVVLGEHGLQEGVRPGPFRSWWEERNPPLKGASPFSWRWEKAFITWGHWAAACP